MALLDGFNTFFGVTGSPDAMQGDPAVDSLLMRLQLAQNGPAPNTMRDVPTSLPMGGVAFAGGDQGPSPAAQSAQRAPYAARNPQTMAPSADSSRMETTKTGDRLPTSEPGGMTTISKSPMPTMMSGRGNQAGPTPQTPPPSFEPSFGERISNFGDALTGRPYVNFADQSRQRNTTYQALRKMGLDDTLAQAAVMNPSLLQAILKQKYTAGGSYGKQVIWSQDENTGEWIPIQVSSQGIGTPTQLPPGVRIVPPGEIAQQTKRGQKLGEAGAEAEALLAPVKSTVENAFDTINTLRTHPGLDTATGVSGWMDPRNYIPGTDAFDFIQLNKQAQAQAFMTAREGLKGAGQVTDFEGTKGEQAIANLSRAQSREQYLRALDTLERMMRQSYTNLQRKADLGQLPVSPNNRPGDLKPSSGGSIRLAPGQPSGQPDPAASLRPGPDGLYRWYRSGPDGKPQEWE